jgi:hypothetical protein
VTGAWAPLVGAPSSGSYGYRAALSAESAYARRVLPIGALPNLDRDLGGDLAAMDRAGTIVAGLAFTATGFLKIRWTRPAGPPHQVGSTMRNCPCPRRGPMLPLVIDVNSPPAAIDTRRNGQPAYASVLCLLTRDGDHVTKVRLDLPEAVVADDPIDAQRRVGHQTARHHHSGAAGSRRLAKWLRGYHPAIRQTPGQHAASGSAGRHVR